MQEEAERWRQKQAHYQDPAVVASYEEKRFRSRHSRGDTARWSRALARLLGADLAEVRSVLDVPCGTGRFARDLAREERLVVQADLSMPMLAAARSVAEPLVQADAMALPFADRSFDLVLCQRFLFHVPRSLQGRILFELGRVSRRFVAVDVRHGRAWSALVRGVRGRIAGKRVSARWSAGEIDARFAEAGLEVRGRVAGPLFFSEKVLVLAESPAGRR